MSATEPAAKKSRYLLTDWNPNDESKWDSKLAWRTLWITTYSLILAFCVWFLPSAIAPKLTLLGFNLDKSQLYWLTALPGLAAGILRLIYMFLPPLIGTRKLVGITSLLGPADPGIHVWNRRRRVLRLHALHRLLRPQAPRRHGARPAGRHR